MFEKRVYAVWVKQRGNGWTLTGQVEAWDKTEAKAKAETVQANWNSFYPANVAIVKVKVSDTRSVVARVAPLG